MQIHNLTKAECRTELGRIDIGHLACVNNGVPYVVPMRFAYDGEDLYSFSVPGKKIDWMRANPSVCVEFDERSSHYQWTSIIVSGNFEELPGTPQYESERIHAHTVMQKLPMWWQPAWVATEQDKAVAPIFFRIRIEHLSGHRATPETVEAVSMRGIDAPLERSNAIRVLLGEVVHISHVLGARSKRYRTAVSPMQDGRQLE
jgi:nitroimidazol reductase NimA-like FMN-containing flavoprotein (pyridoxamine 5'-phosphate oxidase superfamily)